MTFKTLFYIVIFILNIYFPYTFGVNLKNNKSNVDLQRIGSYLVSISEGKKNPKHICTGTLLTDKWIITATRCVAKNNFQPINESLLYYYISNPNILNGKLISVEQILIHPDFYSSKSSYHDIALMKTIASLGQLSGNSTKLEKRKVNLPENKYKFGSGANKTENITNFDKNIVNNNNCCFVAAWIKYQDDKNITLDMKVLPASIRKKNSIFEIKVEGNDTQLPLGAAFISNNTQYAVKTGKNSTTWTPVKPNLSWIHSMISRHNNEQKIFQHGSAGHEIIRDIAVNEMIRSSKNKTAEIKNETVIIRRFSEKGGNKNITETGWFKGFIIALLVGLGMFLALVPVILCCECKISARGRIAAGHGAIDLDERPYSRPLPPPLSLIKLKLDSNKEDRVETRNSKSSMTVQGQESSVKSSITLRKDDRRSSTVESKHASSVTKLEDH